MSLRWISLVFLTAFAPISAAAEDVKIEKGARLFASLCAKSPSTMERRATEIVQDEYGGKGFVIPGEHVISGVIREAIITYNTPAYTKSNQYTCSVHAFRVDKAAAVDAWLKAFSAAKSKSVRLTPVSSLGKSELAKWNVKGLGSNATLTAKSIKRGGAQLVLSWN